MSLPFTLNFTDSTYEYINGYYVIKFKNVTNTASTTGTITFSELIRNISIICVAGGGGGGGGKARMGGDGTGGGGGGAGGSGTTTLGSVIPGILLNVTVGYGGLQGLDGSNSSVLSTSSTGTSTTIIFCTPGKGGTNSGTTTGGQGGQGGNCTIGNGGTGGNGGRGADITPNNRASGQNSWGTFEVPSVISSLVTNRYGGGGGGSTNSSMGAGYAGKDGIGGNHSINNSFHGESATTPGSGGGGGGFKSSSTTAFDGLGGSGASGIVIMYFQYPQYKYNGLSVGGLEYPIGGLVAWVSNTIPDGWAVCDGSPYDTTKYEILFSILGSSSLPNLNAAFLCQTGYNSTYTISGPALRGYLTDSYKQHTHTITDPGHQHQYSRQLKTEINETGSSAGRAGTDASGNTVSVTADISVNNNSDDTETAPYCYGVKWLIKMG